MIRLGGLVSQKAFGKFEMGKVISNPFATAFVNEAEGSEDHEVSMANNSLDTIIKMATELKAKMGENEKDIPAWIQDHITNAENFISQASSNYHEYGQNEARIAEDSPCWKGYKQVGMKDKNGRQVPNCVPNESVVKEISGRTPKIFVKTAAVEKKIKELMADRKKAVVPYNNEKDPSKKEKLKQILIKLTQQIQAYEKNLIQLRDMEEEYIQQMQADAELDTSAFD
jgi:flagellar biosynthesis chaperone FliJ